MTRPCPWAVVLLACLCPAIGAHASMSAFEKKLSLLSTIVKQDNLWRPIFLECVYYKLDRTYYGRIIDEDLLKNARYEPSTTDEVRTGTDAVVGGGQTSDGGVKSPSEEETFDEERMSNVTLPENDTLDRIVPYKFVRNIMFKRYAVGSIVDMGLNVLMLSFKCLLYKHMVHLITLIRVEMNRKKSQSKAASWSGKSKEVIESIVMTMGALQFTDAYVLSTLSFFDIYKTNSQNITDYTKKKYSEQLSQISDNMLKYVMNVCVVRPKYDSNKTMEEQVADMIGVFKVELLYNTAASFADNDSNYKKMVVESRKSLNVVFGSTPRIDGMSKFKWNDILHFQENSKPKQKS